MKDYVIKQKYDTNDRLILLDVVDGFECRIEYIDFETIAYTFYMKTDIGDFIKKDDVIYIKKYKNDIVDFNITDNRIMFKSKNIVVYNNKDYYISLRLSKDLYNEHFISIILDRKGKFIGGTILIRTAYENEYILNINDKPMKIKYTFNGNIKRKQIEYDNQIQLYYYNEEIDDNGKTITIHREPNKK